MIECFECNQLKSINEYTKCINKNRLRCNDCTFKRKQAWTAKYRAKNKESIRQRAKAERLKAAESRRSYTRQWRLVKKYSDTESMDEIHQQFIEKQDGVCAICFEPPKDKALAIDHDHNCCPKTRYCVDCLRGLLCQKCNTSLGLMGDSIDNLKSAIAYLERFNHSKHLRGREVNLGID